MNRQLLIAVLMLFSGSITTAHAETLSTQYHQAVTTSTEALEQAADTTKEWAGKTSEQLALPQKYDAARNSVDKAADQVKTGWDKTSEKLQLQQKYDSVKSSVDTTIGNVQNTWNAPENKAARVEAEDQLKSSWDGMIMQGKKVWQSVTDQPAQQVEDANPSATAPTHRTTDGETTHHPSHSAQQLDASGNYPDPAQ